MRHPRFTAKRTLSVLGLTRRDIGGGACVEEGFSKRPQKGLSIISILRASISVTKIVHINKTFTQINTSYCFSSKRQQDSASRMKLRHFCLQFSLQIFQKSLKERVTSKHIMLVFACSSGFFKTMSICIASPTEELFPKAKSEILPISHRLIPTFENKCVLKKSF